MKLREFQIKEYNLQKEDKQFKLTPPELNREEVKMRLKDEDFMSF